MQPDARTNVRRNRKSAFTLVEVLISTALTLVVVSGVMASVLLTVQSGYRVNQYTDMENESRRALELFGRDVRMAKAVTWVDANTINLEIPLTTEGSASTTYTYSYDPVAQEFWRKADGASQRLISGITSLQLSGYQLTGEAIPGPVAGSWAIASNSTKQIELSVSSARQQTNKVVTAQKVISARFILRNKETS